jgi:hypothetical protein
MSRASPGLRVNKCAGYARMLPSLPPTDPDTQTSGIRFLARKFRCRCHGRPYSAVLQLEAPAEPPSNALGPGPHLTIALHEPCVVRHSKNRGPMTEMGQNRPLRHGCCHGSFVRKRSCRPWTLYGRRAAQPSTCQCRLWHSPALQDLPPAPRQGFELRQSGDPDLHARKPARVRE